MPGAGFFSAPFFLAQIRFAFRAFVTEEKEKPW